MFTWLSNITNRELAVAFWTVMFFASVCLWRNVRLSLYAVLKAFFVRSILLVLSLMSVWTVASVLLLSAVGLWRFDNLKTTIEWYMTFAFSMLFRANTVRDDKNFFAKAIRETVGLTVLVGFVSDLHSFSFALEFLLVPLIALIVLMQAVATTKPEFLATRKLLQGVLITAGMIYFGRGAVQIIEEPVTFFSFATLRDFIDPVLLSLLLLPFMYGLGTLFGYESVLVPLTWEIKDARLRAFARNQIALAVGRDLASVRRWVRMTSADELINKAGIKKSIENFLSMKRNEDRPPMVPFTNGWSPYAAMSFLVGDGIIPDHYEPSFSGWAASALYVTSAENDQNSISYSIEGDDHAATLLSLELDKFDPSNSDAAEKKFERAAGTLICKAIGPNWVDALEACLRKSRQLDATWDGCRVQLSNVGLSAETSAHCSVTLSISREF